VLDYLPVVLAAVDQPTVDGFNTYFVSRLARRAGLTVALSGVGGDELFGGYAAFRDVPRAMAWSARLRRLGPLLRPALWLAGRFGGRGGAKAAELLSGAPIPYHAYLLRRGLFPRRDRRELLDPPAGSDPLGGVPVAAVAATLARTARLDDFNRVSDFELTGYLRQMLLRDADVFSMAHGLEVRTPLLDHVLVEQVAALPGPVKQVGTPPKPLLRATVGERLPRASGTGPKRGFTFPWSAWLRGPLRARARRALVEPDVWRQLGVHSEAPARLWRRFENRDRRVAALQILALLVLAEYAERHGLRGMSTYDHPRGTGKTEC
jgi:asparagine synthase (glutamine-hydrolysing)